MYINTRLKDKKSTTSQGDKCKKPDIFLDRKVQ